MTFSTGILLLFFILGGITFFLRGAKTNLPKPIWAVVFSLPYAEIVWVSHDWDYSWLPITAAVLVLTTAGVRTGRGNFQPLPEPQNPPAGADPERAEMLIVWLKPYMSHYWYKIMGLSLIGVFITLWSGIVLLNPVIALSGLLQGPAYMLAVKLFPRWYTRWGEFFTGAALWSILYGGLFV